MKKPWKRVKDGRHVYYQYDHRDHRLGLPRKRAKFSTAEEARTYHERRIKNAGATDNETQVERVFGEALVEYIETINNSNKLSLTSDETDINTLRWPFFYEGKFHRLESLPINDKAGGIVWGVKKWQRDLESVVKRSYINKRKYHLRREGSSQVWYEQPHPTEGELPPHRVPVTDAGLLARLNKAKGRGPFAQDTFRRRIAIVKGILTQCWNEWRWLDLNLGALVKLPKQSEARISFLNQEQYDRLIASSYEYFGYLIRAAKMIGWRQQNIIGLTWDRVQMPVYDGDTMLQPGFISVPKLDNAQSVDPRDMRHRRTHTKNKNQLNTVMTLEMVELFKTMAAPDIRHPISPVVFHNGDGKHWGDFRKRWATAKKRAGIDPNFRWHDLRHTWATDKLNQGVPKHVIMEEQNWKDLKMVDRYAHLQHQARFDALEGGNK